MEAKVTATKSDRPNRQTKVTITDRQGHETGISLTEIKTAALIHDLIRTLPAGHHLRSYLNI